MKKSIIRKRRFTSLLLGMLFMGGCAPIPGDVSDEINEANSLFMVAFNSGNSELLAKSYTETGKLLPPNSNEVVGREAIQEVWQGAMNRGIIKAELVTITATGYGNTAIEEGRYTLYMKDDVEVDQGKYLVVWEKELGQWKLHYDIWNTSNPQVKARARENDTVMVMWNYIKADKVGQFEDFNYNILEPAVATHYPKTRNTVRVIRPVEANEDGSWTYFYLIDPASSPDGYDMLPPLTEQYGKEQALEYLTMFTDCLIDGKQSWVIGVQTEW